MISLKTYNKEKLKGLIESDQFSTFRFKPVTVHRAVSHIHNPRASEDDTLLILAFDGNQLAGYIGILPDYLFQQEQSIKIGWLSTLFVHPDFRGKKIAQQLLAEACHRYQDNILITEFTPEAESMYIKSKNFEYLESLAGYTYHYRFNLSNILPAKKPGIRKYTSVLKGIDTIGNLFFAPIRKISDPKDHFSISDHLDKESIAFIKENKIHNSFNRNTEEIEWITKYPWVLTGSHDDNYIFSSFAHNFGYVFIKIFNNENILSNIIILSVREKHAKLQYRYGKNNDEISANVLHYYIIKNDLISLICYDEAINFFLRKKLIPYKKERIRRYLINKELKNNLEDNFRFIVSGGDGDCVFT